MTLKSFYLILTGVLLNAAAQLLLKKGTTTLGQLTINGGEIISTALRIGTNSYIVGGLACYVLSVSVWIVALSRVEVSGLYAVSCGN